MGKPLHNKFIIILRRTLTFLGSTGKWLGYKLKRGLIKLHQSSQALFKKKWFRYPAYILGTLFIAFSIFFFSIYAGLWGKLPTKDELTHLNQSLASQLLDRNGEVIGKYFVYDRRPIDYEELPQHLIDALIATEDARFYDHDGVDKISLLRVFFKTLLMQDASAGGGSTISQQLAKNILGRNHSGKLGLVVSKMKEFIVAQRLENVHDKDEIINLYFNTVPFPDYTFGIESASQKFFGKTTRELTLNESAILVGTLKANHSYNPRLYPDRASKRRDIVIAQMMRYGYLNPEDTVAIERDSIRLKYQRNAGLGDAPYFRECIRKQVTQLLKEYKKADGSSYDLFKDGLNIHTTLDKNLQLYAESAMREHMKEIQNRYTKAYGNYAPWKRSKILDPSLQKLPVYKQLAEAGLSDQEIKDTLSIKSKRKIFDWNSNQKEQDISVIDSLSHYISLLNCGFVAMQPKTGSVLAYIGGIDYENFKYDHISQSERMVGSTFKPFLYTTALEQGMNPCTTYTSDERTYMVHNKEWTPSNSNGENDPFTTYSLKGALAHSVNTVAVKVLLDVGVDKVIQQANEMGIHTQLPKVPSLALGTAGLKLIDLAGAYTSFLNDGIPSKPLMITKITDRTGRVIATFKPQHPEKKVMSDFTRQAMIEMMQGTVNEGTANRLRYKYKINNDIAGKTGTTQDNKDAWFVGLMPELLAVTWVGNDDYRVGFSNTSIGSGANAALPIYAKFIQKINTDTTYTELVNKRFERPSGKVIAALDCPSIEKDSTSMRYIIRNIFGERKRDKDIIYINDEGKKINSN